MMKSVNCLCSKSTHINTRSNVPNGEFKLHVKTLSRKIKNTDQILFVEPADRDSTNLLQKQS